MIHYLPSISSLITLLLTLVIIFSKFSKKVHDLPNERSLHVLPTPRIGGVALIPGFLIAWMLILPVLVWWLVVPILVLFAISLLDDIYSLPIKWRFFAHCLAAILMVVGSDLILQQDFFIAAIVLFFTIWMTNLYNFMDGSDGLAGGMTFIGFSMYGIAAMMNLNVNFAMLNFSVASAAFIFLLFNFHPAKLFMGDVGSIPLGFLVASMGLWGWQNQLWPGWFPFLVFSPFIVDASVTLIKRTIRGVKVTEAHREHYYQRLVQLGWGHRNVALAEYVLMLTVGISALWMLEYALSWQLLLVWSAVYASLMLLVDKQWKCFAKDNDV